jgi:hypothetical protein
MQVGWEKENDEPISTDLGNFVLKDKQGMPKDMPGLVLWSLIHSRAKVMLCYGVDKNEVMRRLLTLSNS